MKSDTERKKYYSEKLHKRKSRLHVHLSKDLRGKLKTKKRAILVRKNDRVKIMRGPEMGKEAKVARVNVNSRKVYLEGIAAKNSKGKEIPLALEPSNLLLIGLEPTEERKMIFKEDAFKKEEKKAEKKPEEAKPAEKKEHEVKEHKAHEQKPEHKAEHTEHAHSSHKAPTGPANKI